jgi:hypothetical protein
MMRILQILPRVPPATCGIGDYAWSIARRLHDEHEIESSFLSAGTNWTQPMGEPEFAVFRLPELTAQALGDFMITKARNYDAVVLHMSPYGYQKRGVPLWLASGWQQLSQMPGRPRLITMFHELYASGSVHSSAFWLQPLQKWVLRSVARASNGLRTNRQGYADWLEQEVGLKSGAVKVMPVFSNFGEPSDLPSWENREPAMALFAWGIHSGESLDSVVSKAAAWGRRFGIKRLHLIGCKERVDESALGIEVLGHGFMEASAVSALLSSCRMAYTAYSPQHFGKSTLMAAFAAHGLMVVTQGTTTDLPDRLRHGFNVLNAPLMKASAIYDAPGLEALGTSLRAWYNEHSLASNAKSYAAQLKNEG